MYAVAVYSPCKRTIEQPSHSTFSQVVFPQWPSVVLAVYLSTLPSTVLESNGDPSLILTVQAVHSVST